MPWPRPVIGFPPSKNNTSDCQNIFSDWLTYHYTIYTVFFPVFFKSLYMLFSHVRSGEEERVQEELRQKKESKDAREAELFKAKKSNKGGQDVDDAPEAVHTEQENMDGGIPKVVQNVLTHSSMAIFEVIENGLISSSSLTMEASANVQVFYIEMLENCKELMFPPGNGHAILLQWDQNEHAGRVPDSPPWWGECSAQLQQSCQAMVSDGQSPSSYVT